MHHCSQGSLEVLSLRRRKQVAKQPPSRLHGNGVRAPGSSKRPSETRVWRAYRAAWGISSRWLVDGITYGLYTGLSLSTEDKFE
ncbi:hypothetical protein K491DRAFT_699505 [Lophiostoma macrostomum CBS 122681]|uniref:Uncharacterized protein n=1 Tax=Lophiostoma macrostomum CBS 122681 TaxID=1314788 RepID=A0A6A6SIP1_9PLEO|nr:hypothetical protein K491DRAFT_699505 [Lophiostoma macrostomum CBS 122681]